MYKVGDRVMVGLTEQLGTVCKIREVGITEREFDVRLDEGGMFYYARTCEIEPAPTNRNPMTTWETMSIEHLGYDATQEELEIFQLACKKRQASTGESNEQVTKWMWNDGDWADQVVRYVDCTVNLEVYLLWNLACECAKYEDSSDLTILERYVVGILTGSGFLECYHAPDFRVLLRLTDMAKRIGGKASINARKKPS